jgi:hypothetical protein
MLVVVALSVTSCVKEKNTIMMFLANNLLWHLKDDDVFEHLEGFEHPKIEGGKLGSNAKI